MTALRRRDALAAFAVGVVVLVLCRNALLPGVGFWDTAEFQTVGPVMGTAHPTGFPAWVILGWLASVLLAPFGEPAVRMNLLSAVLIATAAGLTTVLTKLLTGSLPIAAGVGFAFGTTPIPWRMGTQADPHPLHVALVALLLVLLVAWERDRAREAARDAGGGRGDRWLVAASAVFGVAVANHSLTLLLAPCVAVYVLSVDPCVWRRRRLVATCAGVVLGTAALLYLELPLRAGPFRAALVYGTPQTWDGFWYIVLAEQFRGSIVDPLGDLPRKAADLVDLTVTQFGWLAPLVPIGLGATLLREPRYGLMTGLAAGSTVFFAASYENADIGRYYLGPILMAWTWLGILAAAVAGQIVKLATGRGEVSFGQATPRATTASDGLPRRDGRGLVARVVRRVPLAAVVGVDLALTLVTPTLLELPARAGDADRSRDTSAARWLDATIRRLEPDAVVLSWWSYSTPLWYAQHVEGRIPDVAIVDDRTRLDEQLGEVDDVIERYLGTRPVYVIRSDPDELAGLDARYTLDPGPFKHTLVRVTGRREAAG